MLPVVSDSVNLYVDPSFPRFTRAALVEEMNGLYGEFTDGAFRRWQERGLIAAPRQSHRWSKGHEGSTDGLWTGHDREMLRALLQKRMELRGASFGQFQLAPLANIVVWSWVHWDGFVAMDQVRRALRTWGRAPGSRQATKQSQGARTRSRRGRGCRSTWSTSSKVERDGGQDR